MHIPELVVEHTGNVTEASPVKNVHGHLESIFKIRVNPNARIIYHGTYVMGNVRPESDWLLTEDLAWFSLGS